MWVVSASSKGEADQRDVKKSVNTVNGMAGSGADVEDGAKHQAGRSGCQPKPDERGLVLMSGPGTPTNVGLPVDHFAKAGG
jgi:hypothetical protein